MSNRLLKIGDVENAIGFKKSFIYKEIGNGTFPRPLKVGKSSRWKEADIQAWMENLESRSAAA